MCELPGLQTHNTVVHYMYIHYTQYFIRELFNLVRKLNVFNDFFFLFVKYLCANYENRFHKFGWD